MPGCLRSARSQRKILPGDNADGIMFLYEPAGASLISGLAGLPAEGIGSSTKWWFWPNAFMREVIGLFKNRWKQELVFLILLLAFFGTLSIVLG